MTTAQARHGGQRTIGEAMKAQVCCMPTEPQHHVTLNLREITLRIQVTEGKTKDFWELPLPAKVKAGKMQLDFGPTVQSGKRSQYLGPA